jgi:leader peptidase (prepilin peptidase) / N-methyltransferase
MAVASTLTLVSLCIAIAVIDARCLIIPDGLNISLLVTGLFSHAIFSPREIIWALMSACIAYVLFWLLREAYRYTRGHHGLGLGDVKFLAAGTAWVGLEGLASVVLISSLAALLFCTCLWLSGRLQPAKKDYLPFGPFLCCGLLSVWQFGSLEMWIAEDLVMPY